MGGTRDTRASIGGGNQGGGVAGSWGTNPRAPMEEMQRQVGTTQRSWDATVHRGRRATGGTIGRTRGRFRTGRRREVLGRQKKMAEGGQKNEVSGRQPNEDSMQSKRRDWAVEESPGPPTQWEEDTISQTGASLPTEVERVSVENPKNKMHGSRGIGGMF